MKKGKGGKKNKNATSLFWKVLFSIVLYSLTFAWECEGRLLTAEKSQHLKFEADTVLETISPGSYEGIGNMVDYKINV